ncbi:MAG: VIT1/CCC1 transporter family protein [Promethearchaeota archaeon]|nr:MAG: VIT1/CCC1 transporter family protein [Candidatus Lokiarchaeota archaeon]
MFEKFKTYAKITNLWAIARRYFVNNFYDGMLTVLGILLGFFAVILNQGETSIDSHLVILTGLGSSISMFMSGLTGSYLSEKAEQKKIKEELRKAMVVITTKEEDQIDEDSVDIKEIEKAMLIKINKNVNSKIKIRLRRKKKRNKTLQEKAENFASIIVSCINGGSPFLGGMIPLIPFLLVSPANFSTFIISFFLILACIILLGIFLGVVSKESIIKNIFEMTFAFLITLLISIFLLR